MAKFGKKYRHSQIEEWKNHYINYKVLKQKIKAINEKINIRKRSGTVNVNNKLSIQKISLMPIRNITATSLLLDDLSILYQGQFGQELKEFIDLLDSELNKCYLFFILTEKELYKKVNAHLITQTNYINYNLFDIYAEMNKLNVTVYFIKCLNSFIYDNMNAIKKILKKFDKKLSEYCGKIQTKYILHQLTITENNKLEYILRYKTIDEALTICESNLNELYKYFNQNNNFFGNLSRKITLDLGQNKNVENNINTNANATNNNNINVQDNTTINGLNRNNIKTKIIDKRKEIIRNLKDIDELAYFKIQYGDWFYYLKEENDKLTKHSQKLLENDIFNPILSASYKNDNIIMKFLSKKDGGSEIKQAQIPMSLFNKINISFIIIHTFFYHTLITCIYPLLFIYIKHKNNKHIYSFLTIVFTYLSSFLFMIIYHNTKIKNIKTTNNISYILFFIGSLGYILAIKYLEDIDNDYIILACILGSRVFIGLGNNIMMGKKYITIYSPRFYVANISLYYIIFQILGLAFGPFIGGLLLYIPESKIYSFFEYNNYNCIGWYGCIGAFVLFVFNCALFTGPDKSDCFILKNGNKENSMTQNYIDEDFEDAQDKEYNRLQIELINSKKNKIERISILGNNENIITTNQNNISGISDISSIQEQDETQNKINNINNNNNLSKRFSNLKSQKNLKVYRNIGNIGKNSKKERMKSLTENDLNEELLEKDEEKDNNFVDDSPLLITVEKEMNSKSKIENDMENTNFNLINMIPRTIDDIIRKEKISFGYMNHNLLVMFLLLFFNNMIKENYIAYFSYFITDKESFNENDKSITDDDVLDVDKVRYTCLLTGCAYLVELLSIFFIFPFHKINYLFKKYLITSMILTNILMVSLSILLYYEIKKPYLPIISLLILINMMIEVISSSYLSYLLPPGWKFSNIRAGALTVYIMTFGKICGILFCLVAFSDSTWNYFGISIIIVVAYTIISIYLYKSPNLRIKSICRIMQLKKLNEFIF